MDRSERESAETPNPGRGGRGGGSRGGRGSRGSRGSRGGRGGAHSTAPRHQNTAAAAAAAAASLPPATATAATAQAAVTTEVDLVGLAASLRLSDGSQLQVASHPQQQQHHHHHDQHRPQPQPHRGEPHGHRGGRHSTGSRGGGHGGISSSSHQPVHARSLYVDRGPASAPNGQRSRSDQDSNGRGGGRGRGRGGHRGGLFGDEERQNWFDAYIPKHRVEQFLSNTNKYINRVHNKVAAAVIQEEPKEDGEIADELPTVAGVLREDSETREEPLVFCGTLRINKKATSDAYVTVEPVISSRQRIPVRTSTAVNDSTDGGVTSSVAMADGYGGDNDQFKHKEDEEGEEEDEDEKAKREFINKYWDSVATLGTFGAIVDGLEDPPQDVMIYGARNRNRAMDGDLVAIQILSAKEAMEQTRKRDGDKNKVKARIRMQYGEVNIDKVKVQYGESTPTDSDAVSVSTPAPSDSDWSTTAIITSSSSEGAGSVTSAMLENQGASQSPAPSESIIADKDSAPDGEDSDDLSSGKVYAMGKIIAILDRPIEKPSSGVFILKLPSQIRGQSQPEINASSLMAATHLWFKPSDLRMPFMFIPRNPLTGSSPLHIALFQDPSLHSRHIVHWAKMRSWPEHKQYPYGTLLPRPSEHLETLLRDRTVKLEAQLAAKIAADTSVILGECGVTDGGVFPAEVVDELHKMLGQGEGEWQIPQDEYTNRRVMTGHRIFSIDPSTAKDLDDALSVRKLSVQEVNSIMNDQPVKSSGPSMGFKSSKSQHEHTAMIIDDAEYYEIGVHIADVSYFVRPDTKLDTEAQSRATTIYLVDRAVPMLPHILSEQLCSLNPGTPRLAFSAVFTIRVTKPVSEEYPHDDVSILQTWLGRTIINSCCKMAYQNAQAVIEGGHLDAYPASSSAEGRPQLPPVSLYHGVSSADVENDILLLDRLAKSMRARRFATGSVSLDKVKFGFDLDTIKVPSSNSDVPVLGKIPSGSSVQIQQDSNRLIEEFMLLANTAVAHHIAAFMPRSAFLRRHPFPLGRKMNEFLNSMASLAPHYQQLHPDCAPEDNPFASFSARSSLEIHQSLSKFTDERTRMAVIQMCVVPMQRARYFPGGAVPAEIRKHYALNEDLYTHFTSPIRRYPDVIVHRMVQLTIDIAKERNMSIKSGLSGIYSMAATAGLKNRSFATISTAKAADAEKLAFWEHSATTPVPRLVNSTNARQATAMINVNESAVTSRLKLTADSLVELASHCNARKELARAAQDNSDRLFITVLLVRAMLSSASAQAIARNLAIVANDDNDHGSDIIKNPLAIPPGLYHYAEATVIDVMPRAIKVYVHGFGIERQLHYDQMQINNVELDAKGKWVRLHWSQDDNSSETAIKEIKMDEAALRKILHPSMFFNASDKGVNEGIDLENRTQSLRITSIVRVKVYPELKENGFAQMEVNMARPIQFD